MALFGRGAIESDAALVKLGREGIDGFIAEAQRARPVSRAGNNRATEGGETSISRYRRHREGLGTQFLIGLLPGLTSTVEGFTEGERRRRGFKAIGAAIGSVLHIPRAKASRVLGLR